MPGLTPPAVVNAPQLDTAWEARLDEHVMDLAFSPDGRYLAAISIAGPLTIYESASGEIKATLPGHAGGGFAVSWRADSLALATGGQDGAARIWDPATGACLHSLEAGAAWVERLSYAPYGSLLATAAGRKLKLWNADGALLRAYPDHPSTIADLQWQPGEELVTTACYGQLATFRPTEDEPLKRFDWKGSILSLAWSPDGNYVATGNQDASVHFWYRKSGKDLEMSGYPIKVRDLAWDAGSRYLATGGSAIVIVWDCRGKGPAGSTPIQLDGHDRPLSALAWQYQGPFLASGAQEGRVCLWRPGKSTRLIRFAALGSEITRLRWAPGDRLLAASCASGLIRVFRPAE